MCGCSCAELANLHMKLGNKCINGWYGGRQCATMQAGGNDIIARSQKHAETQRKAASGSQLSVVAKTWQRCTSATRRWHKCIQCLSVST